MNLKGVLYLLVLVGCYGCELGLREGEGADAFSRERSDFKHVQRRLVHNYVHARLVFVHGLKDDLNEKRTHMEFSESHRMYRIKNIPWKENS